MAQALTPELQRQLQARLAPCEALAACHARVIEHLQVLSRLIDHLERVGVNGEARLMATTVMRFFEQEAHAHHRDEERTVFPPLLAGTDLELVRHVQRLQLDHGWLEEDWRELALQLSAVADGYSWYDLDALRAGVEVFTALYHDHIALEESLIYPQARRALSDEVDGLGRRLAEQRRAFIG